MRYVDGIPVVPKHTAMIDFLNLCQSGSTMKSVTLDSEMRKSSVDGSWALIETEESGLSSRVVVEKIREAIIEDEEGDPDFHWAIVEPADAVAIKKEMIDAGDASDVEDDAPAGMVRYLSGNRNMRIKSFFSFCPVAVPRGRVRSRQHSCVGAR